MKPTTLKALTYITFAGLILLAQACGNKNKSGDSLGHHKAYLECSRASAWAYCTGKISNKLLRPNDFYDYYCYEDYKACLNYNNYDRKKRIY